MGCSQKKARCEPHAWKVTLMENNLLMGMGDCISQGKLMLYSLLGSVGIKDTFAVTVADLIT